MMSQSGMVSFYKKEISARINRNEVPLVCVYIIITTHKTHTLKSVYVCVRDLHVGLHIVWLRST